MSNLVAEARRIIDTWPGEILEGYSVSVSFSALEWNKLKKFVEEEEGKLFGTDPVTIDQDASINAPQPDQPVIEPVSQESESAPVVDQTPVIPESEMAPPDDLQHTDAEAQNVTGN